MANLSKKVTRWENFTYILECLGVDITCISTTHTACSGCWGSSSLRDHGFMLNSARTHHSIYSSVCHCTSSTESHACVKREQEQKNSDLWWFKLYIACTRYNMKVTISIPRQKHSIFHIPWAMVEPMPPSNDPPPLLWVWAGGGAWLTASGKK